MIKKFSIALLIFTLPLIAGCSKEKPAEPPPAAKVESPIFTQQIDTLHKAEALDKAAKDSAAQQQKEIDAATQ